MLFFKSAAQLEQSAVDLDSAPLLDLLLRRVSETGEDQALVALGTDPLEGVREQQVWQDVDQLSVPRLWKAA